MKLSLLLPPKYDKRKWTLASQIGVKYAITKAAPELTGILPPYDFNALKRIYSGFKEMGFELYGLEGDQFDMSPIKLGLENRDEWIEKYQQMIRNMGRLEIPLLCYNFMALIGWYRTKNDIVERGGALTSEFNSKDISSDFFSQKLRVTEDEMWNNLFYFLDAVLPVAQECGVKMALHPDDPPINPFMGIARILTSAKNFDRIMDRYNNTSNGITFCQATFKIMNEDLFEISKKWIKRNKIFFIHLRDISGDLNHFRETFIDNGPTPIAEMINHYYKCGYDEIIRSDHVPNMYGEKLSQFTGGISSGYDIMGHLFATGYIKGVCDSAGIYFE